MNIQGYSPYARGAAMDIANNKYKILLREKYQKIITCTLVDKFPNGLGKMIWLDAQNLIVAEHIGELDFEYYPIVGKLKYDEITHKSADEDLISVKEYAEMHGVSPDSVRQKILRGNLKAEKIGRNWCIDRNTPYVDNRTQKR